MPRTVIVSRTDLMRYHDPVRIRGYCQSCEKFGMFWSCPPFSAEPMNQLDEWTHAVLVTQKTAIESALSKEQLIERFLAEREILCNALRGWEGPGAVAAIAGHCEGCSVCTRSRGIDCAVPSRMRYSLEALGFDVTGIAEGLAGERLQWPTQGMPDYLITVGAVLCSSLDVAKRLDAGLAGVSLRSALS